jgi:ADP-ribose pyrophosphatase YjhB (NUDIX family)
MNTIIVAGPVIVEDSKVLLVKHGDDKFWKFPGGRLEDFDFQTKDDVLEETCRREVKEEMGIEIEIVRSLLPMLIRKDDDTNVILLHYLAKRVGEIAAGDDIAEWKWVDIDNLPNDIAPNIKVVINELIHWD